MRRIDLNEWDTFYAQNPDNALQFLYTGEFFLDENDKASLQETLRKPLSLQEDCTAENIIMLSLHPETFQVKQLLEYACDAEDLHMKTLAQEHIITNWLSLLDGSELIKYEARVYAYREAFPLRVSNTQVITHKEKLLSV